MKKIKRLFEELEKFERIADAIDEAIENDPENEELEIEWNEAYNNEWNATEAFIAELTNVTGGMIDNMAARKMLGSHRNELKSLISRIA